MTDKEKVMTRIKDTLQPILKVSKGINYNPDGKAISRKEMNDSEVLEIENYEGYNIKIIVK